MHIITYAGVNNRSILIPENADLKGAAASQQKKKMSDIVNGSNTTSTRERIKSQSDRYGARCSLAWDQIYTLVPYRSSGRPLSSAKSLVFPSFIEQINDGHQRHRQAWRCQLFSNGNSVHVCVVCRHSCSQESPISMWLVGRKTGGGWPPYSTGSTRKLHRKMES